MNRLERELAYVEKEQEDRSEIIREGKGLLCIWLMFRLRSLRKAGFEDRIILQDLEFEIRKNLT